MSRRKQPLPFSVVTAVMIELLDGPYTRAELGESLCRTYNGAEPTEERILLAVKELQRRHLISSKRDGGKPSYSLNSKGRETAVTRWEMIRRCAEGPPSRHAGQTVGGRHARRAAYY